MVDLEHSLLVPLSDTIKMLLICHPLLYALSFIVEFFYISFLRNLLAEVKKHFLERPLKDLLRWRITCKELWFLFTRSMEDILE